MILAVTCSFGSLLPGLVKQGAHEIKCGRALHGTRHGKMACPHPGLFPVATCLVRQSWGPAGNFAQFPQADPWVLVGCSPASQASACVCISATVLEGTRLGRQLVLSLCLRPAEPPGQKDRIWLQPLPSPCESALSMGQGVALCPLSGRAERWCL